MRVGRVKSHKGGREGEGREGKGREGEGGREGKKKRRKK